MAIEQPRTLRLALVFYKCNSLMVGEKVGRIGLIAVLYDEDGRIVRVSWHRWIKTIQRVVSLMLLTR